MRELQEPAELSSSLFRLTGVGVVETDLQTGRFRRVNEAFCAMLGYTEAELLGQSFRDLTHPDDLGRDEAAFLALQQGETREGTSLTRVKHKDGHTVWLELAVTVLGEGDAAVDLAVAHDVTERRRAEKRLQGSETRFRAFVTASSDVVYRISPDWSQMRELDGRGFLADTPKPADDWMVAYIHPDDREAVQDAIDRAVRAKSMFELEHRVLRADGTLGWARSRAVPVLNEQGEVAEWLGAARDVTDRKRSEEALREAAERLTLALSAARMGEWSLDLATGEATHSPLRDRIFGYKEPLSEWTYETFLGHVHPDDRAFVEGAFERSRRTGEDWEFECRIARADGDARWIWASGSRRGAAVPGTGGRMYGLVTDITERKRYEANAAFLGEVSQNLANLTNIDDTMNALGEKIAGFFGLSACAFAELTEDAQVGVINHGWHRADTPSLLGTYRMAEFMTDEVIQSCRAGEAVVIRDVFADPRTDGEGYAALNIGSFVSMPLVRGGEWRFLLVVYRSEPHNWQGDEVDLLRELADRIWTRLERARAEEAVRALNETLEGRVEERTEELRRSERRFSQAFHVGPVAACISTLNESGGDAERFLEVNDEFCKLTGYERDEVVGRSARELGMWSSREDQRTLERSNAQGGEFHNLELHLRTKGGEVKNILLSGAVIRLDGHHGRLKLFYDVTESKRTERQLAQAINEVMSDTAWFSQSVLERFARIKGGGSAQATPELSPRERQVLAGIAQGKNNAAIAAELELKPQTVRNYVATIYDKLGIHTRAEAVVWARERGLAGF